MIGVRRRGAQHRIEVHDTGLGVPAESREAIFEEFLRLEPAQRTAHGLGLGLSIVRRLATMLDHDIGLNSDVGRGSRFWITARALSRAAVAARTRRVAPRGAASSLAGMLVCVIENEPHVLDGMRVLLAGWDCSVIAAASLAEARDLIAEGGGRPDALIADFHLDDGTGLQAIAALRTDCDEQVPAVLVTADRSERVRAEAAAHDVVVLHKPLRPAALRAALTRSRPRQEAAE